MFHHSFSPYPWGGRTNARATSFRVSVVRAPGCFSFGHTIALRSNECSSNGSSPFRQYTGEQLLSGPHSCCLDQLGQNVEEGNIRAQTHTCHRYLWISCLQLFTTDLTLYRHRPIEDALPRFRAYRGATSSSATGCSRVSTRRTCSRQHPGVIPAGQELRRARLQEHAIHSI